MRFFLCIAGSGARFNLHNNYYFRDIWIKSGQHPFFWYKGCLPGQISFSVKHYILTDSSTEHTLANRTTVWNIFDLRIKTSSGRLPAPIVQCVFLRKPCKQLQLKWVSTLKIFFWNHDTFRSPPIEGDNILRQGKARQGSRSPCLWCVYCWVDSALEHLSCLGKVVLKMPLICQLEEMCWGS